MKKEIRLMLDYQCYPIWIYDENGNFIDNDLIEEIKENEEMVVMLETLQNNFDSLYLNTKKDFKYIGFNSNNDKQKFEETIQQIYRNLCDSLGEKYRVKNMISIQDM